MAFLSMLLNIVNNLFKVQCMKSVQIRNYFWSKYSKIRSRKNSVFGHFLRSGYLLEQSQRIDINNRFKEWCKTLLGVNVSK